MGETEKNSGGEQPKSEDRHETRDISVGRVFLIAAGLVMLLAVSQLFVGVLSRVLSSLETRGREESSWVPEREETTNTPEPRLQVAPRLELEQVEREAASRLDSYGWVDRQNGIVRIPVERALELMADRGFPVKSDSVPLHRSAPERQGDIP